MQNCAALQFAETQPPFFSFLDAKLGVLGLVRGFSDGIAKKGWAKLGMGRACSSSPKKFTSRPASFNRLVLGGPCK